MVKYSPETLNRTFAALADPTRRRILSHLARGSKRVTHLARRHDMSLPAVSKHLRVLEKAGLLRRRRYGRVHEMQLDAKPLKQAARVGRGVSQILGRLARSAGRIFGKNTQSRAQEEKIIMCPVCFANFLLVAIGATSSGGLTTFALAKFLKRKKQRENR